MWPILAYKDLHRHKRLNIVAEESSEPFPYQLFHLKAHIGINTLFFKYIYDPLFGAHLWFFALRCDHLCE